MPQAKYVIDVPAKLQVLFLTLLQMRLVLQLCYLVQVATKEDEIDLAVGLMLRKKLAMQ